MDDSNIEHCVDEWDNSCYSESVYFATTSGKVGSRNGSCITVSAARPDNTGDTTLDSLRIGTEHEIRKTDGYDDSRHAGAYYDGANIRIPCESKIDGYGEKFTEENDSCVSSRVSCFSGLSA